MTSNLSPQQNFGKKGEGKEFKNGRSNSWSILDPLLQLQLEWLTCKYFFFLLFLFSLPICKVKFRSSGFMSRERYMLDAEYKRYWNTEELIYVQRNLKYTEKVLKEEQCNSRGEK